jgi:hypothetical protein
VILATINTISEAKLIEEMMDIVPGYTSNIVSTL